MKHTLKAINSAMKYFVKNDVGFVLRSYYKEVWNENDLEDLRKEIEQYNKIVNDIVDRYIRLSMKQHRKFLDEYNSGMYKKAVLHYFRKIANYEWVKEEPYERFYQCYSDSIGWYRYFKVLYDFGLEIVKEKEDENSERYLVKGNGIIEEYDKWIGSVNVYIIGDVDFEKVAKDLKKKVVEEIANMKQRMKVKEIEVRNVKEYIVADFEIMKIIGIGLGDREIVIKIWEKDEDSYTPKCQVIVYCCDMIEFDSDKIELDYYRETDTVGYSNRSMLFEGWEVTGRPTIIVMR